MPEPTTRSPFANLPIPASLRRLGTAGALANIEGDRAHQDQQVEDIQRLSEVLERSQGSRAHPANPRSTN